ncbi:MAG: putative lipid II flippase FtsW [Spirochaetes bacterium]|nr:MAG: putative lipid II flippase FtsW [Spirochaetota bacterium]
MNYNFSAEKIENKQGDFVFTLLIVLLAGIGISALFSASYYYGNYKFGDSGYFFIRQLSFMIVGFFLAFSVSRIPLPLIIRFIPLLLFISLILMLATFIPGIGREMMGGRRWIIIAGKSFQPSEFVKLSIILYLAGILSKKHEKIYDFFNSVLPPFLIVGIFTALIIAQNDFSTAAFVMIVSLSMFYVAGVRYGYFVLIFMTIIPLAGMLLFSKEHRVRRIMSYLDPGSDPSNAGYQVLSARRALSNGGFWGAGIGLGTQKLGGLPEAHSDFIFAVIGEEAGILGVTFIIVLFLAMAVRGYALALKFREKNLFAYFLTFGLTTSILYQALINMAVVSGMLPVTGITLPFFSHGGSSIIVTFIMCGLLLNLSRNQKILLENIVE